MKTDLYTRVVLTVIAVSLSVIALQQSVKPAYAQNSYQKVIVCNPYGTKVSDCASVTSGSLQVQQK
jgi:hypothetical protein